MDVGGVRMSVRCERMYDCNTCFFPVWLAAAEIAMLTVDKLLNMMMMMMMMMMVMMNEVNDLCRFFSSSTAF